MTKNVTTVFQLSLIASAIAISSPLYAASWLNDDATLEPGTTIQAINANSNKNSYTSNPALANRAWGMQGSWLSFNVQQAADVVITLSSANTNAPGFTVYKTDGPFTTDQGAEGNKDGIEGAKHAFNQVAQAGDPGLVWATDSSVEDSIAGNTAENGIIQTLGYVNGSTKNFVNYWGYQVAAGAHDLSINNHYENGVFGSVSHDTGADGKTNYASLTLINLQPGYYTLFLGGTDTNGEDTPIDVKVTATPLSVADCLMNSQEQQNPSNFPHAGLTSQTMAQYYFRAYSETGHYLGLSSENAHMYRMGADGVLTDLGSTADLATQSGCQ